MTSDRRSISKTEDHRLPREPSLPGLQTLLDGDAFNTLLTDHLGDTLGRVSSCNIVYIRYKPGTNCIIAYDLKCGTENLQGSSQFLVYAKAFTDEDYRVAVEKSQNHRWIRPGDIEPVVPLPDRRAILYIFPNDPILEGLRLLSDPRKIQRILYEYCDEYPESKWRISDRKIRLTTMRYKPERRVVLRCDTRAIHRESNERRPLSVYLRFYGDDRGRDVFAIQETLYARSQRKDDFRVPRPIAYIPKRRLLVMDTLPGLSLYDSLSGDTAWKAISKTATALAGLHKNEVEGPGRRGLDSYLAEARSTLTMLKSLLPEAADAAEKMLAALEKEGRSQRKADAEFVHGDFYYGQVLVDRDEIGIIDFDRSHNGHALSDIGNFCAHLKLLRLQGRLAEDSAFITEFIRAYEKASGRTIDARGLNFWIAFGLYLLSVGPFRRLEGDWRNKIRGILEECRQTLS